jgi:Rrf2 family protein
MKVLTMNTDYAIRALLSLANKQDGYTSAREIAVLQNIPYQYLRRILQILIRNGLIESKEGAGGGVRLIEETSKIKVADVMRMFQGNVEISNCLVRGEICANRSTCVLRKEMKRIEKLLNDEFGKITIRTLLRGSKRTKSRSGKTTSENRRKPAGSKQSGVKSGKGKPKNRSTVRGPERKPSRNAQGTPARRGKRQ